MRDFFTFNGISSADFGCFVADANQFDSPARDVESVNIPGMNGSLTIDNGRYLNMTLTYSMYTRGDIRNQIMGLRNALTKASGFQRLEDTYDHDEFYLARYIDGLTIKQSDRYRAGFTIAFERKPQRFLKTGEIAVPISNGSSLMNETDQIAKPLIRAYGTGTISIGGNAITVTTASGYTDIDCDIQEAYKGSTNCNGNVSGAFPELVPGENAITISGFSQVEITPRWWRI